MDASARGVDVKSSGEGRAKTALSASVSALFGILIGNRDTGCQTRVPVGRSSTTRLVVRVFFLTSGKLVRRRAWGVCEDTDALAVIP